MQKLFPQSKFVSPKHGKGLRLVVAKAPGEDAVLEGEPLAGSAGKWFDGLARKAGIKREDLTFVNTINCRPPGDVHPLDSKADYISPLDARKAVSQCMQNHVRPLVNGKPWTRIDALGEEALYELTGEEGILYWRGSPLKVKGEAKERVIATIDPSYIVRDQTMIPIVVNDLKKNTLVPPEYYNLQPSLTDLQAFTAQDFAFDIETKWGTKEITLVGLCAKPFHVIVVPFTGQYVTELKRIFANSKTLYAQNCWQFDIPVLKENGIHTPDDCQVWDIMLLHHLLFPQFSGEAKTNGDERKSRKSAGGHGLEFIASQFTNKPAWKEVGRGGPGYWERRNAIDTDVTLQAARTLVAMARQEKLVDLYNFVQVPLARICHQMQEVGIKIDPARLIAVRDELLKEIAREEVKLPETLRGFDKPKRKKVPAPEGTLNAKGKPVKFLWEQTFERKSPWRSGKVMAKYLYEELGIPPQKHPKTKKTTTDKSAVEKYIRILRREKRYELVPGIQAYQKVKKAATLISSFCKEDMTQGVARMHPHFNVHGTSGGRLSSSDPNFQNQPEKARYMYVPDHKDWKFVEVDYSNIEPRLTAYFAQDLDRLARFSEPGYNDHKYTTSIFFDIPYEEVVKDNDKDAPYGKAKRINNGLNYGMGALKIANTFDLELKEVKDLVFKWKTLNAATEAWQKETSDRAKADGYLTTPFGRKRWFYTNSYFTESLSFLPQSSAADIIYRSMVSLLHERINWPFQKVSQIVRIVEALPKPARLHLQVHDSLLFGCPGELVDEVVEILQRVMQQGWPELGGFAIPIEVKVSDSSWGECELWTPEAIPPVALAA